MKKWHAHPGDFQDGPSVTVSDTKETIGFVAESEADARQLAALLDLAEVALAIDTLVGGTIEFIHEVPCTTACLGCEWDRVVKAAKEATVVMGPAVHVLWSGTALCADPRLRSLPGQWPRGQRWIPLRDVEGAVVPVDHCRACWDKAPQLVAELQGLLAIGRDQ